MSQVTYRQATESDFDAIKSFYKKLHEHFYRFGYRLPSPPNVEDAWQDTYKRTLGKFSIVFIAEYEDQMVGFLLARIKRLPPYMGGDLVGELSDEWIEPSVRRLGVGSHMCHLGLAWLKEQKVHSVEIQVLNGNDASWNMLSAMGFKQEFRVGRLLWDEYIPEVSKPFDTEKS